MICRDRAYKSTFATVSILGVSGTIFNITEYVKNTQLNVYPGVLTTNIWDEIPSYVLISAIVLVFLMVIGIFITINHYIHRKFKSIDSFNTQKKQREDKHKKPKTYLKHKKLYKKTVHEQDAKILPGKQNIIYFVDFINKIWKHK